MLAVKLGLFHKQFCYCLQVSNGAMKARQTGRAEEAVLRLGKGCNLSIGHE